MTIARNRSSSLFYVLTSFALATPLDSSHTYRFTLQVSGTIPVVIVGTVERFDNPSWTVIGTSTIQDGDGANAVTTPGVVGFSAGGADATGSYAYDNFAAQGL
jgi:hypothetical protein